MDWEVRPEAMVGYFTTVGGVSPPSSLLHPPRLRGTTEGLRPPSPGVGAVGRTGAAAAAWAVAGEKQPFGYRPNENDGSDGTLPDTGGDGVGAAAVVAGALERAAVGAPHIWKRSSDPPGGSGGSSVSWHNNVREGGAVGGGGDGVGSSNSWGW